MRDVFIDLFQKNMVKGGGCVLTYLLPVSSSVFCKGNGGDDIMHGPKFSISVFFLIFLLGACPSFVFFFFEVSLVCEGRGVFWNASTDLVAIHD